MPLSLSDVTQPVASRWLEGRAALDSPLVRELLAARLVAVFATFDEERGLHAVPLWFARDGGSILLATGSGSRKVRNVERDPRATLVLHDSRPGFEVCGVSMSGRVVIVRAPDAGGLIDLVHRKYVDSASERDPDVAAFLESDDVALRFRPESALTWDERASAASTSLRLLGGAKPLLPTSPRP